MSQTQAVNELYVTETEQEAVALTGRLWAIGIDAVVKAHTCKGINAGAAQAYPKPYWVVIVEYPMDLERARDERTRYFRDMGWAK